jgi:NlpC/P60 family putative phage cell wall peptidase
MTTRADIVASARRWIGTPYLHQASLIHIGCDCLGLLRGVWRETMGAEPETAPPYTPDWNAPPCAEFLLDAAHRHFTPVSASDFQEGDVLVFRFRTHLAAKHVGIATSRTHMAHAHSGACVTEIPIGAHWRKRIAGAFTFPGLVG